MTLLTACMASISLSDLVRVESASTLIANVDELTFDTLKYKPITPVLLALVATLFLGINMNIVKYYDKNGFPSDVFAFSCYGVTNFLQAIVSIFVFYHYGFNS